MNSARSTPKLNRVSRHSTLTRQLTQMTVFVSENHRVPNLSVSGSNSVTSFSTTNTTTMQTTSDYDSFRTSTVPSVTTEEAPPDCEMENNETCENRQTPLDVIKHFSTGKMTDHRLEGPKNSCAAYCHPFDGNIQENTPGPIISLT